MLDKDLTPSRNSGKYNCRDHHHYFSLLRDNALQRRISGRATVLLKRNQRVFFRYSQGL